MKKGILLIAVVLLSACGSTKKADVKRPLYEILVQKETGGAKFRFFEIISEADEFIMIKNDPELKKQIEDNAIATSNFLILSQGEKPTGGYGLSIEKVEETATNILVTIKENQPEPGAIVIQMITSPYAVVRINSKKPIQIQ